MRQPETGGGAIEALFTLVLSLGSAAGAIAYLVGLIWTPLLLRCNGVLPAIFLVGLVCYWILIYVATDASGFKSALIALLTALPLFFILWGDAALRGHDFVTGVVVREPAPTETAELVAKSDLRRSGSKVGAAKLFTMADGGHVLRLENVGLEGYERQVNVYLLDGADVAKSPPGAAPLGQLRGTKGSQNFVVPAGRSITGPMTVLIRCTHSDALAHTTLRPS